MRSHWLGLLCVWGIGCGSGKGSDAGSEGDASPAGEDSASPDDTGAAPQPLLDGKYVVGFSVGPVAGLVVPLQVEIQMSLSDDGQRTMDTFILRASDGADQVSEDLATVTMIPVDSGGGFSVDIPMFTLPGEFSPTSNPVDIDSVMTGEVRSSDFFCGEVSGSIVSFEMDLDGSTFAGSPWRDRILGAPTACEETQLEDLARVTDCPALEHGRNTGVVSGELEREVELILPEGHDPASATPLLIALHGIGSTIDAMVEGTELREHASAGGFIVAAPGALDRGGTAAWDPVGAPGVNEDIVLIDDLITCVTEQHGVDPDRVYVTGMSLGGLMTGTLLSTRSDVFAAAAPFSGGFMTAPSADTLPIPTLVSWGGSEDTYYGQDFDYLAGQMLDVLSQRGHGVIACNHGQGHSLDPDFWPWALGFLAAHTRGEMDLAFSSPLPDLFPDFCQVQ